jgi:hypothetical protein
MAYDDSGTTIPQEMRFENVHGNGGLLTTVGDLLRWNQNFTAQKLGGKALFDAQHERARLNDGATVTYAAGLVVSSYRGLSEVSHSGSTAGYRAWLARYPEQRLSVTVLCNAASANAPNLGQAVADVFLAPLFSNRLMSDQPIPGSISGKAGQYRSTRDHGVMIVREYDGRLIAGNRALRQLSPHSFVTEQGTRGEFDLDSAGNVVRLRLSSAADPNHVYEKVEPATPSRADMEAYAGEYTSDEAEVTLRVALDGNALVIRRRPDSRFALTPAYKDGFASSLGSVRFLRDASGRVTELSIGEGRAWDLRFRRQ